MTQDRITEPPPKAETPPPPEGWADLTGNVVPADYVQFTETVWRNKKRVAQREIIALVAGLETDRKGDWVVLEVVRCEGKHGLEAGSTMRRARRNIERSGTWRKLWDDETARVGVAER